MRPLIPALLALTLALSGCSSEGARSSSALSSTTTPAQTSEGNAPEATIPTPSNWPNGLPSLEPTAFALEQEFHLETPRGAKVSVRAPASSPPGVDDLRNRLKIKPGRYLLAHIDNRSGFSEANVESVTYYDAVGNTYMFTPVAPDRLTEWGPFLTDEGPMLIDGTHINEDQYRSLNTRARDLQTKLSAGVGQGFQGSTWLFTKSTNLPREVTRVMVKAQGTASLIHAYPKGVQGYAPQE